jgi:hypothetical protein
VQQQHVVSARDDHGATQVDQGLVWGESGLRFVGAVVGAGMIAGGLLRVFGPVPVRVE